ncbi:MAG: formylglycine-generating enzyme family protein [Treponema sp.]|nr:formylglycine-generating enzyme family protein [Treponema sp.]
MKRTYIFLFILVILVQGLRITAVEAQTAATDSDTGSGSMILIDAGTFTMGSPSGEGGRSANEGPQHQVTVSSFYMDKYPVTQAEYKDITGKTPSMFKGDNLPVEQVSWFDAVDYCNKLSVKEGLTPVYKVTGSIVEWISGANGYRLPTEAEWEYACRAGTKTPYSGGTSVAALGWYSGNSGNTTHPVGLKQPNAWGIYDMHGNVLEWCWDWLGNYTADAQTDPRGPVSGTSRVYRGGCWRFEAYQTRSAFRFGNYPNLRTFLAGFRVVRDAEQ